jgi:hypothetical protein
MFSREKPDISRGRNVARTFVKTFGGCLFGRSNKSRQLGGLAFVMIQVGDMSRRTSYSSTIILEVL